MSVRWKSTHCNPLGIEGLRPYFTPEIGNNRPSQSDCPPGLPAAPSRRPNVLTTIPTTTQRAAPYRPYHIASCDGVTPAALNTTSEPVELTCMSCANNTLLVFM